MSIYKQKANERDVVCILVVDEEREKQAEVDAVHRLRAEEEERQQERRRQEEEARIALEREVGLVLRQSARPRTR